MECIRVLHTLDALNQGGIENLIINVYRNIDRDKVQFDFALRRKGNGDFESEIERFGGRIYYFDKDEKSIWNYKRNLSRIIRDYGPYQAVHSHNYFFSGYILAVAKREGISIRIAHAHDTKKGKKETLIRKLYEKTMQRMILHYSTDRFSCSDEAGKYVFGKYSDYNVLYNGIDLKRFEFNKEIRDAYRQQMNMNDSFVIIHVGRFADQKNHMFMIDVLKDLTPLLENWRMIFIGDGELFENVKLKAEKYGIDNRIVFLSGIKNTECYYDSADVFIFPSKYEGLGIVAVEAQVNGLPSLISDKVTREVGITKLSRYLSISEGTSIWVNQLIEINNNAYLDRKQYIDCIKETEFDINVTVETLMKAYMHVNNE